MTFGSGEEPGQEFVAETSQADIEVQGLDGADLNPQQILVPARIQAELIVGENVRPLLRFRPAFGDDDRDVGDTEQLGGFDPTVAGDYSL